MAAMRSNCTVKRDFTADRFSRFAGAVAEALEPRRLLNGTLVDVAAFNSTNGAKPAADVAIDPSGNLYTTTEQGGASSEGAVVEVAHGSSTIMVLASFAGANGNEPLAGVTLDSNLDLFGTTYIGGASNVGTVYEIAHNSNAITTLASFNGADGSFVGSNVVLDSSGDIFGVASQGGTSGDGTVWEVAAGSNAITALASFNGTDGATSYGGLAIDSSGNLFGTAKTGGSANDGTVFEVAHGSNAITTLASFNGTNGSLPFDKVTVDSSDDVFGTTESGGPDSDGTVFEIVHGSGAITTLASFDSTNGANPYGSVVFDSSDDIFGATSADVFEIAAGSGTVTDLANFGGAIGFDSLSGVTIDSTGNLFGTVFSGAANSVGAIFEFSTGPVSPPSPPAPIKTIGQLDPTFGINGLASYDVGFASTEGLALDANGDSIILGTIDNSGIDSFGLTRYTAAGTLDTTFGTNGVASVNFGGSDQPAAVTVLSNGDILVAGTAINSSGGSQFALAEFTSSGVLDTSFGNGSGEVLTSFSATGTLTSDVATALAIGRSGTIYVGGSSNANDNGSDFAIAAYNADGSLDTSFGFGGKTLLDFAGFNDAIASLALQSNGDIVAAGSSANAAGVNEVALARFLPSGQIDPHFGSKGKVLTAIGSVDDQASSVVIDSKGKIIVGGLSASGSASDGSLASDFLLLRYNGNGTLDKTFGGGPIVTSFNQPAAVTQLLIQPNGDIVASGKTTSSLTNLDPSQLQVAIARYMPQGRLDNTFNSTGTAIVSLSSGSVTPGLARFDLAFGFSPQDTATNLLSEFQSFVNSSQGAVALTQGGDLLDVGNSGVDTVEAAIVAAGVDLAAKLIARLPAAALQGAKGNLSVTITEDGSDPASGTVTIQLYASPDGQVDSGLMPFQSASEKINLKAGQSRTFAIHYSLDFNGNDYVVADVVDGSGLSDLNPNNNAAASSSAVDAAAPFVQLSAGSTLSVHRTLAAGKTSSLSFTIANDGNVLAHSSPIEILASPDGTFASGITIAQSTLALALQPNGKSRTYHLITKIPATLSSGSYTLLAVLDPNNTLGQPTLMNNVITGPTFTVP